MKVKRVLIFFLIFFTSSNIAQSSLFTSKLEKVIDGLKFPEGPAWDGTNLYISSCYGGYITKVTPDSSYVFVDSINNKLLKQTNGLTFDTEGNLFACDFGLGAILKITPSKEIEIYANGYNGEKFNRPNDLAFDKNGNLYFTDPKSYGKDKPDGSVYRIDKETKEVKQVETNLAFPNGIAFSNDGKNLFVCESAKNRVLKYEIDENGYLQNKRVFVLLPGGDPDGIAFDVKGNLYVAHFGTGNVYVVSPEGNVIDSLSTPGQKPSNVEFGGEDLRILFITEDETNSVYKIRTQFPGKKLVYKP